MSYSDEQIATLHEGAGRVCDDIRKLVERMMVGQWHAITKPRAREYLFQGVCRRFNVIRHCIERIFEIFPPEREAVLEREELLDVQSYLHALIINVYGVLDNLAWVFITERDLEVAIGARPRIGLFIQATQQHLPAAFRTMLQEESIATWFRTYAKNYRDALAHRVPLYVPPYSVADDAAWKELEEQVMQAILAGNTQQADTVRKQQKELERVCPTFLHSTSDPEGSRPLILHAQVTSDALTVVSIANALGASFGAPA